MMILREKWRRSRIILYLVTSVGMERTLMRNYIWEMADWRKKICSGLDLYVELDPINTTEMPKRNLGEIMCILKLIYCFGRHLHVSFK